jgi:endonuclease V-like protein UPF0215 family
VPTSPPSFSKVVGFDDSLFDLEHRGAVCIIGSVCVCTSLDGVLSTTVRRDGSTAIDRLLWVSAGPLPCARLVSCSP